MAVGPGTLAAGEEGEGRSHDTTGTMVNPALGLILRRPPPVKPLVAGVRPQYAMTISCVNYKTPAS